MQLIPVSRDNPPADENLKAPENIITILKKSCFDCHSNETKWPWYSYIAPVSFLIAHDVHEAREHLNFSAMSRYGVKRWNKKLANIREEIEEKDMPLPIYLFLHKNARLTSSEVKAISDWTHSATVYSEKMIEGKK